MSVNFVNTIKLQSFSQPTSVWQAQYKQLRHNQLVLALPQTDMVPSAEVWPWGMQSKQHAVQWGWSDLRKHNEILHAERPLIAIPRLSWRHYKRLNICPSTQTDHFSGLEQCPLTHAGTSQCPMLSGKARSHTRSDQGVFSQEVSNILKCMSHPS